MPGPPHIRHRRRTASDKSPRPDEPVPSEQPGPPDEVVSEGPTSPAGEAVQGKAAVPTSKRAERRARRRAKAAGPAVAPPPARHGRATKARRRARRRLAMLAGIVVLAVMLAAVALAGILVAASMPTKSVKLPSPLLVYPVFRTSDGPCLAGTHGISGQGVSGPVCYQVTEGIAIHWVRDIRVLYDKSAGYEVSIRLRPGDRKAFRDITRRTLGRHLAFVVRNRLVAAPRVEMPILGGEILITGLPTRAEADQAVRELHGTV